MTVRNEQSSFPEKFRKLHELFKNSEILVYSGVFNDDAAKVSIFARISVLLVAKETYIIYIVQVFLVMVEYPTY
jgi:hypothetical protein